MKKIKIDFFISFKPMLYEGCFHRTFLRSTTPFLYLFFLAGRFNLFNF